MIARCPAPYDTTRPSNRDAVAAVTGMPIGPDNISGTGYADDVLWGDDVAPEGPDGLFEPADVDRLIAVAQEIRQRAEAV